MGKKILMLVGDFVEDYDVIQAGGRYVAVALDKAYADGPLVTAPAWPAHPDWLAKFLAVLEDKKERPGA